jgi:hypothetical protein
MWTVWFASVERIVATRIVPLRKESSIIIARTEEETGNKCHSINAADRLWTVSAYALNASAMSTHASTGERAGGNSDAEVARDLLTNSQITST